MDDTDKHMKYMDCLSLRGEAAEGSADRWLDEARKKLIDVYKDVSPERRNSAVKRLEPLIRGKYENLLIHERREVRAGKIRRLEDESEKESVDNAHDVVYASKQENDDYARQVAAIDATYQDMVAGNDKNADAYRTEKMNALSRQRAYDMGRKLAQIQAVADMGGDRFQTAVETGLFDQYEGDARRRQHYRTTIAAAARGLIEAGLDGHVDALADALEADDSKIARKLRIAPAEIGKLRDEAKGIRKRREAEANAAEAEGQRMVAEQTTRSELEIFTKAKDDVEYYAALEKLSNDPTLRRVDPARALNLAARAKAGMESISSARAKEAKLKDDEAHRALKEDLSAQANWLLVPPNGADEDQIRSWHTSRRAFAEKVEAAFASGRITGDEFHHFRMAIAKTFDDAHVRAINYFDRCFGLDRSHGMATPADVTRALASKKASPTGSKGDKIKPDDLAVWRNRFLDELDALAKERPTANLDEFARKAAETVMTHYAEKNTSAILEGFAEARYAEMQSDVAERKAAASIASALYPDPRRKQAEDEPHVQALKDRVAALAAVANAKTDEEREAAKRRLKDANDRLGVNDDNDFQE